MPEFCVQRDIGRAYTLDKQFYLDEDCFRSAKEKIFAPSWQFLCDSETVSENGSAFPLVLLENYLDEPLLLTRDADSNVHCLSNVCTHRGNLVVSEPCRQHHFRCRYHGRLFDLAGKFVSMPEFQGVENFPSAADDLHALPLFQWGKLLFTSLHPAHDPAVFFAEIMQRMHWFPLDRLQPRTDLSRVYTVKAH